MKNASRPARCAHQAGPRMGPPRRGSVARDAAQSRSHADGTLRQASSPFVSGRTVGRYWVSLIARLDKRDKATDMNRLDPLPSIQRRSPFGLMISPKACVTVNLRAGVAFDLDLGDNRSRALSLGDAPTLRRLPARGRRLRPHLREVTQTR
jgi:hypothetical protein